MGMKHIILKDWLNIISGSIEAIEIVFGPTNVARFTSFKDACLHASPAMLEAPIVTEWIEQGESGIVVKITLIPPKQYTVRAPR